MSVSPESVVSQVAELAELLVEKNWTISTAESCTGGMVAAALTDLAGSSGWFGQGVVSYSNEAKMTLLGVDGRLLREYGAVSQSVVEAMATGALQSAAANVAVSISGIAGPDGGTVDKPVGTVWIGWAIDAKKNGTVLAQSSRYQFDGDRTSVREHALIEALRGTIQRVKFA